uniref:Uncharacterized protein n=1 Tax=Tetraselmis sp. GSL018 TaxID=582737 RepID=A0A061RCF0_9CHLO
MIRNSPILPNTILKYSIIVIENRERKARVGQEVQREYERQQLHEELQQRTRDFVDSMWQSLE